MVECRASQLVEDGMAFCRAQHAQIGVPTWLQRALLEEACSPDELQATSKLRGNRVACTAVTGAFLIAHPVGQAGNQLSLSVLTESSDGGYQVQPDAACTMLFTASFRLVFLLTAEERQHTLRTSQHIPVYAKCCRLILMQMS
jgi:hypothetical protein